MTLYLVYLDREHLGDPLFLQGLAQAISRSRAGEPPCILLHGSGEKVERTLEAEGIFPDRVGGVLDVDEPDHLDLVERAVREVNQQVVGTLTDEVVSTVGIQGDKRNLFRRDADGTLQVGSVGWIEALVQQRVVPVLSALADDAAAGRVREVWAADLLPALAEAVDESFTPTAVFFTATDDPGLPGHIPEPSDAHMAVDAGEVAREALADVLSEPEAVTRGLEAGLPALLTTPAAFADEDGPRGTLLRPRSSAPRRSSTP